MCAALKAARQGYYAWKSRPPSAHALRNEELAIAISQLRDEVRSIYGAPKTLVRLRSKRCASHAPLKKSDFASVASELVSKPSRTGSEASAPSRNGRFI